MSQNQFKNQSYTGPGLQAHASYSPKKSNPMKVVLIVFGMVAAMGLLCCVGVGGLAYFELRNMAEEVKVELAAVSEIKEHIGDIRSFRTDYSASFEYEDADTYVYDIEGTKGNGRVQVQHITGPSGKEVLVSGELILPDGQVIPLSIDLILSY
ncbi:MAG: hypothetical protein JNL67_13550 [Planctomycetaceae bacterium]|nr:hypothetical protein [Planctomycetaceae bacterium]